MNSWQDKFNSKLISPAQAAQKIRNGDRIYLGSMCSEPKTIIRALEASSVQDVEIVQFIAGSEASRLAAGGWERFRIKTFFVGAGAIDSGAMPEYNYVPLYHSQIPFFFRNRRIPIDVAIIQVAEPDRFVIWRP